MRDFISTADGVVLGDNPNTAHIERLVELHDAAVAAIPVEPDGSLKPPKAMTAEERTEFAAQLNAIFEHVAGDDFVVPPGDRNNTTPMFVEAVIELAETFGGTVWGKDNMDSLHKFRDMPPSLTSCGAAITAIRSLMVDYKADSRVGRNGLLSTGINHVNVPAFRTFAEKYNQIIIA